MHAQGGSSENYSLHATRDNNKRADTIYSEKWLQRHERISSTNEK